MADDFTAPAVPGAAQPAAAVAEPALQAPAAAAHTPDVEAVVRAWVSIDLANSPVSRATDAWNHLQAALPRLIAMLKEEL
jgi:hypothetical protein